MRFWLCVSLAPAFLLLKLGQVGWANSDLARYAIAAVSALYMVCAILRLARFNLETTTDAASTNTITAATHRPGWRTGTASMSSGRPVPSLSSPEVLTSEP